MRSILITPPSRVTLLRDVFRIFTTQRASFFFFFFFFNGNVDALLLCSHHLLDAPNYFTFDVFIDRIPPPPPSQRDAIKKTHQTTTLQNKIALEADKMRKELAKNARKTQKGERRSGRG